MKLRYTKELTSNGIPIKVHAISTGYVSVKKRFRESRYKGIFALLDFLIDKEFTEWMPIWVWVVEHPEGIFLIDTGENSNVNDKDYFKPAGWFNNWVNTSQFKFKVSRADEVDQQLALLGIQTTAINTVILTHRHLDHVDGLKYFQHATTLIHRIENEKSQGDLPHLYPKNFKPTLVDLEESFHHFPKSKTLTKTGDLRLIHTPGHTHGHCSISLQTDEGLIFFAGDVSYHQAAILNDKYAGADVDIKATKQTYKNVKATAKATKLIYLPSHDSEAGERLIKMSALLE